MAKYTQKAIDAGICGLVIHGRRWVDTHCNTYHKVYISGVDADGNFFDLLHTDKMHYGYSDQFVVTAGDLLIEAGFVEADSGYDMCNNSTRIDMNVSVTCADVKRKKDM